MAAPDDTVMLRVYLGEADSTGHHATYKQVILTLRGLGIKGATAMRGISGYGGRSLLHAASPLRLSVDLPIIIEAVDERKKIEGAIRTISPMVKGGLIVVIPVTAYDTVT